MSVADQGRSRIDWLPLSLIMALGGVLGFVAASSYASHSQFIEQTQYLERLVFENRQRWAILEQRLAIIEHCLGIDLNPAQPEKGR